MSKDISKVEGNTGRLMLFSWDIVFRLLAVMLVAGAFISGKAEAVWSDNPAVNNAISTATGDQAAPTIVSDGSGGAIITWMDSRNTGRDIYAQRIDSNGDVQWIVDGVAISTASGDQWMPAIVSDGSGGAIITWYDERSGTGSDVYAQRIDSNGDVQWTADGVAISTATGDQYSPTIVSDGSGGAIITWTDNRNRFSLGWDIYAQRIDSNGVVQWTTDGVPISIATGDQAAQTIVSDGNGGAIIAWVYLRSAAFYDIYAQRINEKGDLQWSAKGVAVGTVPLQPLLQNVVSDGSGGAIITWYSYGSNTNSLC